MQQRGERLEQLGSLPLLTGPPNPEIALVCTCEAK